MLLLLIGEGKPFEAEDSSPAARKILDDQTPVEKSIILKTGAQVMLLKNINIGKGLVNGARGVITKFVKDGKYLTIQVSKYSKLYIYKVLLNTLISVAGFPVIQFKSGQEYTIHREKFIVKTASGLVYSRKQIPVRLAWAFSIHKSQV